MDSELQKLRIDKAHKARRDVKPAWPWVLIVLLLAAGGAGVWEWHSASGVIPVQTLRVRPIEGAAAQSDSVVLNATGYVMAAHKIELASKVIGRVAWVGVEMGDKIKKGQLLVRLEDDEYRARLAQQQGQLDNAKAVLAELEHGSRPQEIETAKAKLDQSRAELANAEINLKRLQGLESTKAVSRQQIDDADALVRSRRAEVDSQQQQYELARLGPRKEQIDAQRATVRQLEGSLDMCKLDLDNTLIRSPISGTVLQRNVEVGEFVTNGFVGDRGAKGYVLSIADLNDLRVELDISQNDFAKVSARQPCWIVTDAYPDRKYRGIVDLISPEANRQKATVEVRVKVLNPDDLLKPDMNATVSFLAPQVSSTQPAGGSGAGRPVIRVPAGAVRDGTVFVVENGRAVKRVVTTTKTADGRELEIRSGLIGGEDLITSPPEMMRDGDRVKAVDNIATK